MKKIVTGVALFVAAGFVALHGAEARWGGNPGQGLGAYCNGPGLNQQVDLDQASLEKFWSETEDLRNLLAEKRNEYFETMNSEDPDKEYAAQIWSEMFDLKLQIREKAEALGLERGFAMGPGVFPGPQSSGRLCGGPGNCWKNSDTAQ